MMPSLARAGWLAGRVAGVMPAGMGFRMVGDEPKEYRLPEETPRRVRSALPFEVRVEKGVASRWIASVRPSWEAVGPGAGMIGMIAAVVLIEAGLARSDRFANDMAERGGSRPRPPATRRPASDILCFGDSLSWGLPAVLEERLGGKAYNLATRAGTPSASYYLLRRAAASGGEAEGVGRRFHAAQDRFLNPGHEQHRLRARPTATVAEAIDLGWTMPPGDLTASILLGKIFTSIEAAPRSARRSPRASRARRGRSTTPSAHPSPTRKPEGQPRHLLR